MSDEQITRYDEVWDAVQPVNGGQYVLYTDHLAALTRQSEELAEARKWRIAMEGLTPTGSEFVNDLDRCLSHIRDQRDRDHKRVVKFKLEADKLREELAEAKREITAHDIRMDNDAAELARLRTELDQARAELEAADRLEAESSLLVELLRKVKADDGSAWRDLDWFTRHEQPNAKDAIEYVSNALAAYQSARTAKPEQAQQGGEGE